MRVACVLVTHLRAKVEMSRQPHLGERPVVIIERNTAKGRTLVVDQFPAAKGVTAGMTLEQAMSRLSDAVVLDADEPHYRRVFDQVLRALQRVSDRVEEAELGTAYVRIDGLERLHRGEARVVSALLNAVPEYLMPRLTVADSKFPAYVAARTSPTHGASRVPEDPATFLAPHPVDLLPIPSKMKTELHRLGLHTMGQIASLGERLLTDRFGLEGRRAWRLCTGTVDEAVHPMAFEATVAERMSLSFPTSLVHALSLVVDTLLRRAYARPEMRGRYAGRASLRCDATGWTSWERSISFREPAGRWESASYAIRSRLESDPPDTSVEEVTLTLSSLTGEHGTQMGLFDGPRRDLERRIAETERRLRGQAGRCPRAVQGGGGGSLAPCTRDACPSGAGGPLGAGGRQAAPPAGARGGQGGG